MSSERTLGPVPNSRALSMICQRAVFRTGGVLFLIFRRNHTILHSFISSTDNTFLCSLSESWRNSENPPSGLTKTRFPNSWKVCTAGSSVVRPATMTKAAAAEDSMKTPLRVQHQPVRGGKPSRAETKLQTRLRH
jgi:hypothetical protein